MDFGRLPSVDRIAFEMPPHDPRSDESLRACASTRTTRFFLGAPVWTCPRWQGLIFPKGAEPRDYLSHYARHFNTVELNSTFYQILDHERIHGWTQQVSPSFRFAPKVHQGASHEENPSSARASFRAFLESVAAFGENLGTSFLQLPPTFRFDSVDRLRFLFDELPDRFKLAVEFRHPSWFRHQTLRPEAFALLRDRGVGTVITDVAGRRDVLHGSLTTAGAMVRFVGNELHPSDFDRARDWARTLAAWAELGIEECYIFVHQPTQAEVPELASFLAEELSKLSSISLPIAPSCAGPSTCDSQLALF